MERSGTTSLTEALDETRDFHVAGELIASVSSIYDSHTPGTWKELELYRSPNGVLVCVEIWRTVCDNGVDRYWLTTRNDLSGARSFFGDNALAAELFAEASAGPADKPR